MLNRYGTFHLMHDVEWHYKKAANAFCIHLWEGFWRGPYLDEINPDYLLNNQSNFARLMRKVIGEEEILSFKR